MAGLTDSRERLRRFLIRAMSRAHEALYRASDGRLLGRVAGMPVPLLTTTGRGSGKPLRPVCPIPSLAARAPSELHCERLVSDSTNQ